MQNPSKIFVSLLRRLLKLSLFEKLFLKFTMGNTPENIFVRLAPQNYHYKKPAIRNVKRNNIFYQLDISDYIQWWIYFGVYEKEKNNLYELAMPGSYIMDVGSNIGEIAMNLASKVGPSGKIFCFEPDRLNYKRLQDNLALNHFTNISTYHDALGNDNAEYKLYGYEGNRGCSRIVPANTSEQDNYSLVRTITIDQWRKENSIQKIDLIKIDTEGFEMKILQGAVETISMLKPILYIELDDVNLKLQHSSAAELISHLAKSGYRTISSVTGKEINEFQDFAGCHYDIICNPV